MKRDSPYILTGVKSDDYPNWIKDKLSPKQTKIINAAAEICNEGSIDIGFVCRSMVTASMPHSKPNGIQYKRQSQNFTLTILGNEEAGGVPYGTYPRLILSWLSTEVVKKNNREIILGESLSDFMKKLGLLVTGGRWGTIARFREQLKKLFSSHIQFTYYSKKEGSFIVANMSIAEKAHIFWDPAKPEQIDLFKSKVTLSENFFDEIIKAPIPVDIRAINVLKDSSLSLDIYFWLTYRLSYLASSMLITFDQLQMQFGGGYADTSQGKYEFKRKFLIQLRNVLAIYPEAKVFMRDEGILIYPSLPHVKKIPSSENLL